MLKIFIFAIFMSFLGHNLVAGDSLDTTFLESPYSDHQIEVYVKQGENLKFKPLKFKTIILAGSKRIKMSPSFEGLFCD